MRSARYAIAFPSACRDRGPLGCSSTTQRTSVRAMGRTRPVISGSRRSNSRVRLALPGSDDPYRPTRRPHHPLDPLKVALHQAPELDAVIFALLQSLGAEHLTREGRVYGGGLHKLEPKELARLLADAISRVFSSTFPASAMRR